MEVIAETTWPTGETLADLRRAAGKTTYQAAAAIGLTQPRIPQMEKEGLRNIDQMQALADFYGVPLPRLIQAAKNTKNLCHA